MIKGVGIDLCDIERMKKAIAQKGFCERVFSDEEIAYANSKASPESHFAAAFAAREAIAKAGGWGMAGVGLDSCSVTRTDSGPRFVIGDEFQAKLDALGVTNVHLSISHDGGIAAAFVVLEGKD